MIEPLLRWTACAGALLLFAAPAFTSAQDRPIVEALEVRGADGCVEGAALAERLAHWLGRPAVDPGVRVELWLTPGPPPSVRFTLHRAEEPPAERAFSSLEGDCDDRVDAVALALAIALDPEAVSRRVEADARDESVTTEQEDSSPVPEAELPPPEEAVAESPPGGDDGSGSTDDPPPERRFAVALGGGILWGGLEAIAPMAVVAFDVAVHPALRLRVAGVLSGARHVALGTRRYDARLVGGEVGVRAGGGRGRWRLEGEAGLLVAAFLARGEGFGEDLRTRRPWVALAVGPRAEVTLTEGWALALSADALVSLLRARVHVMDPNGSRLAAATTPVAGMRVSLEGIARFRGWR